MYPTIRSRILADFLCHQTLFARKEKPAGLDQWLFEHAPIVVCFISDAYFHSIQHRNELFSVMKMGKRIIPILVLDFEPESKIAEDPANVSNRCSRPKERDFWTHGNELCQFDNCFDVSSLSKIKNNFSSCKKIKPFVFSDRLMQLDVSVVDLHLHSNGELTVHSDFSLLGVKFSFFDVFILRFGTADNPHDPRATFVGLRTEAVMQRYVFQATKESKLSFCCAA